MIVIPAPNEVAFKVLNFPIYWYGIILAFAIFVGIITANKLFNGASDKNLKDVILSYAPLIIFAGILGARLYFCALNPGYYMLHPLEILDFREGGLSIHGAIIGGILSIVFISFKEKISFLQLIDPLACSIILAQAIGRWGNYFNSEAYGLPVASQNWGLFIPYSKRVDEFVNYRLFHPTFLYESLLDLTAFLLLFFIYKKFGKSIHGLTFFAYFVIYGLIRILIEGIRIDSALNIGSVPIAKIISLILVVVGVLGLFWVISNHKKEV